MQDLVVEAEMRVLVVEAEMPALVVAPEKREQDSTVQVAKGASIEEEEAIPARSPHAANPSAIISSRKLRPNNLECHPLVQEVPLQQRYHLQLFDITVTQHHQHSHAHTSWMHRQVPKLAGVQLWNQLPC